MYFKHRRHYCIIVFIVIVIIVTIEFLKILKIYIYLQGKHFFYIWPFLRVKIGHKSVLTFIPGTKKSGYPRLWRLREALRDAEFSEKFYTGHFLDKPSAADSLINFVRRSVPICRRYSTVNMMSVYLRNICTFNQTQIV